MDHKSVCASFGIFFLMDHKSVCPSCGIFTGVDYLRKVSIATISRLGDM